MSDILLSTLGHLLYIRKVQYIANEGSVYI